MKKEISSFLLAIDWFFLAHLCGKNKCKVLR